MLHTCYTCTEAHPLTFDAAKTIAHSIVSSRLDYANALLHGTWASNLNITGRTELTGQGGVLGSTLCQCHRVTSATSLVANSPTRHLQDSSHHIQDTLSTGTPTYLSHLIRDYLPAWTLWSSEQLLLTVPRTTRHCRRKSSVSMIL